MTQPVLITGASRGLGAALAECLAPHYPILALAKTVGALEELDDRIQAKGGTATLIPMDITDEGALRQMCRAVYDKWGSIDLWCHTAVHAAPLSPADHIAPKDWQKSVDINVTAVGKLIPMISPLLTPKTGAAVFFDDPLAGTKFHGAYGSTKAAQISLARSWAAESVNTGPRVHIAQPSPMPTATRARFYPGEDRNALTPCMAEAQRIIAELGLLP